MKEFLNASFFGITLLSKTCNMFQNQSISCDSNKYFFWIGSILKRCINTTKHCKFQPIIASLTPHTKHVYRQTLSLNETWPNALCILQTATNLLTSVSKIYNNRLIELKTNRFDEQCSNISFITKWGSKFHKGAGLDT